MTITISRGVLETHGACSEGLALFDELAGGGLELTREWTAEDDAEFRRLHPDYWQWMLSEKLLPLMAPACGPRGQEVLDLLAWLPTIPWFKPPKEPDHEQLRELVTAHLRALKVHAPACSLPETAEIEIIRDPAAAWDAARAAARDAAWDAAWDAQHLVSGLSHNPWSPLVEIWALGAEPIGIVDGEFVVYVAQTSVNR